MLKNLVTCLKKRASKKTLALDDVSGITHVRQRYLQALDEGRYDDLPEDVYARNFLKLYAQAIDLEAAPLLELYRKERGLAPKNPVRQRAIDANTKAPVVKTYIRQASNPLDLEGQERGLRLPELSGFLSWLPMLLLVAILVTAGVWISDRYIFNTGSRTVTTQQDLSQTPIIPSTESSPPLTIDGGSSAQNTLASDVSLQTPEEALPETVLFSLITTPIGADFTIDGYAYPYKTPVSNLPLSPGENRTLIVTLPGYEPYEAAIDLTFDRSVSLALTPGSGTSTAVTVAGSATPITGQVGKLVVVIESATWFEAYQGTERGGSRLAYTTAQPGEQYSFNLPVYLHVGNAGGVRLNANNQDLGLMGNAGQVLGSRHSVNVVWLLALHALRLRPLRTVLTALGIAVAVASTVIFLSLGEGLRQVFRSQIGNVGPDIQVSFGAFDATSSFTSVPELPLRYVEALWAKADKYEILEVTPLLFHLRGGLTPGTSFIFQGVPTGTDVGAIYVGYTLSQGRNLNNQDEAASVAVIGIQVAERNNLSLGSTLRLNPQHQFEVVGIASSDSGIIDNAILVPLESLQKAIGITDRVTFLALDLAETGRASEVAAALGKEFPNLGFQTRTDVLGVINEGIRITDVVRLGISAIALIVGAIAVANTMLMSVFERTKEFGVVRAVGAKPRFLFGLVVLESLILSFIGAAFGVVLGQLGIVVVNSVAQDLIGLDVAALTLRLTFFAVIVAFVMGLLSGLLPAARAARIPIAVAMARD